MNRRTTAACVKTPMRCRRGQSSPVSHQPNGFASTIAGFARKIHIAVLFILALMLATAAAAQDVAPFVLKSIVVSKTWPDADDLNLRTKGVNADGVRLSVKSRRKLKRLIGTTITADDLMKISNLVARTESPDAIIGFPAQNFADGHIVLFVAPDEATWGPYGPFGDTLENEMVAFVRDTVNLRFRASPETPDARLLVFSGQQVVVHFRPVKGKVGLTTEAESKNPDLLYAYILPTAPSDSAVGRFELKVGASYANLFGRGHNVSVDFVLDPEGTKVLSHDFKYIGTLSDQRKLTFTQSGSWSSAAGSGLVLNTTTLTRGLALRYFLPGTSISWLGTGTLQFGVDRKTETVRSILAGGFTTDSDYELVSFALGYSRGFRNRLGAFKSSVVWHFAPGNLGGLNTDTAFDAKRSGATARFGYAVFGLAYDRALGQRYSLVTNLGLQVTGNRLLPSEQFTVGGTDSVRGYRDSAAMGDQGFRWSFNVSGPVWRRDLGRFGKMRVKPMVFYDGAFVTNVSPTVGETDKFLHSVGVGFGLKLGLLRGSYSYGRQLGESGFDDGSSDRHHIQMSVPVSLFFRLPQRADDGG